MPGDKSDIAWQTQQSVETKASPGFAWTYMTDVKNWDDPPAQFRLDGPFVSGSCGTTEMPGQPSRHWQLREVLPIKHYTVELQLEGAVLACKWLFEPLPDGRTTLTQQITLQGENASAYQDDVARAFGSTLHAGMNKIAMAMDRAYFVMPR